tara:strand:- start:462 stop:1406 length:945 start_codon:yes stop_codon:yes gene_type:complete
LSRILITGGAGFIGRNLVNALHKSNDIIILDNEFRGSFEKFNDKKIEFIKGDITKFSDWEKIPSEIDSIFHLGAINGTKFFYEIPEKVLDVNIKGVQNLLEFCRKRDVKNFLFTSSSEVYGYPNKFPTSEENIMSIPDPYNPRFSYSSSKIIGEMLCINFSRKYNLKHTIVRYHNIYGPNMGHEHVMPEFIRKVTKNEEFLVEGDGTETRSFCFIDDAIDATIFVHNDNSFTNRIFNIGNDTETSISNLIELLSKISGKQIQPKFNPKTNPGTKRRIPDISKARSIGYEPKITLEEGFKITYDWYNNYYKKSET